MSNAPDPVYMLKECLLANLRNGQWGAGERIPAERHLGASYGVGRSTVRRVLREMKELGLVEQTVGSGTFVARDYRNRLPPVHNGNALNISPAELMEARLLLEPVLIDLVVRSGTAADFAAMEECCRQGELAATPEQFEYWDGAFHQRLAQATHNNFVISLFELVARVRECGEWGMLKKRSMTRDRRIAYQGEHRALVKALRDRDAAAARQLLVAHLDNVRRNLFDY